MKSTQTTPRSTYPSGKLYVTLHDGDAFGVYSTEIPRGRASQAMERSLESHARVLKEMNKEGLRGLLQSHYSGALPAQADLARLIVGVCHHIHRDFADLYSRSVMLARGEGKGAATHDARKGEFSEEEVSAALVLANLAECERARTVATFLALRRLLGGI